jgi:hypothetical protein
VVFLYYRCTSYKERTGHYGVYITTKFLVCLVFFLG